MRTPRQDPGCPVRCPHLWGVALFLVLLAVLAGPTIPAAEAATRVIKLKAASAGEVIRVLQQTFGRQVRAADAPMINAVVLNADSARTLEQAAALVTELDQPPVSLRFSVRRISEEEARGWQAGLARRHGTTRLEADQFSTRGHDSEVRTVVGLEGYPVALTDETTRVIDMATPWGPQTAVLRAERGLRIVGRRAGEGQAVVEVRYAQGGEAAADVLVSQVSVPLGAWAYLGDVDRAAGSANSGIEVRGSRGGGSVSRRHGRGSQHYLVRVDLANPGP